MPTHRSKDRDHAGPSANSLTPSETIARAFESLGIAVTHEPAAEAQAHALTSPDAVRAAMTDPALVDLCDLPFVTIDNPGSRDLDQALHIECARGANTHAPGGDPAPETCRVRYALADAAHFVRPGSALFDAALARAASYYAPGRVAPMLPRALSEGLVSLEPGVERRALVFDLLLDAEARLLNTTIVRARIRSRAQLTYRGVQAFLDGAPRGDEPIDPAWSDSLRQLRRIGVQLVRRARERGVVAFDRREPTVEIVASAERGRERFVTRERERLDVEEWNAQVSLLCNTAGAALLLGFDTSAGVADGASSGPSRDSPDTGKGGSEGNSDGGGFEPIYRVHDAPDAARLRELRGRLDEWTRDFDLDERFRWPKGVSLADYVDALPDDARERGRVRAVQRQILVLQRASEFSAEPGRHHALAVAGYARFSSPMREIVGVHVHRELLEALDGESEPGASGAAVSRAAVIEAANAAKRRQKALDKRIGFAVIADLLAADLRGDAPSRPGIVLGVRRGARGHLYIGIDDLAIDLKVDAIDLRRRHGTPYTFETFRAVPADRSEPVFTLGDEVAVRVVGYDEARARFLLDLSPRGRTARRERRRAERRA